MVLLYECGKSTKEAGSPAKGMNHRELTPRQQRLYGALALVLALLLMVLLSAMVGGPLLKFAKEPEKFQAWVDSNGLWGRLAYMGMVIVQVVIALIPGEPFEIAAGYAFGALEGTVLCLTASTLGSLLVFGLVRRFGMRLVQIFFSREKLQTLRFLRASPRRDFLYLLIFMIPGTPKDLLCYFAGLTDVRFPVWLIICSLGRLPAIITSTVGGSALSEKNYWTAVAVFAVTFALSAVGMLIYNYICKRNNLRRNGEQEETAE